MVVLPLFWDQYDNAQRMHETGFGIRLDTYGARARGAARARSSALLADGALRERLARVSAGLQAAPGTAIAADVIERVAAG